MKKETKNRPVIITGDIGNMTFEDFKKLHKDLPVFFGYDEKDKNKILKREFDKLSKVKKETEVSKIPNTKGDK